MLTYRNKQITLGHAVSKRDLLKQRSVPVIQANAVLVDPVWAVHLVDPVWAVLPSGSQVEGILPWVPTGHAQANRFSLFLDWHQTRL